MNKYSLIKKEFAFLESEYGFKKYRRQKYGSYHFLGWTNGIVDITVLYDDTADVSVQSPVWITIFYAESLVSAYTADEIRDEFAIQSGTPKERIRCAAKWLREAIENKTVRIE